MRELARVTASKWAASRRAKQKRVLITKKQHFVPQVALRRFSYDGERIFVYDKIANEVRIANIRDIAQQRYFYDIPAEALPLELQGRMDRQMIERTLSGLESEFNIVVSRVIGKTENRSGLRSLLDSVPLKRRKIITRREKEALSFFVALQYLRTREFRLTIKDGLEKFEAAIRLRIPPEQIDSVFEGFRGTTDADVRMHHLSLMFDDAYVDDLTRLMYEHILVIGANRSNHKLYTSDNPMVKQPHKSHPILRHSGISSPGIEIAMPLSSDRILIFMEKKYFKTLAAWDRKLVDLNAEQVEYYNSLQVRGCDRQVYCADDDFDLAREFCQRWPARCAEQRPRVVVE